jgi:hypothetical protein
MELRTAARRNYLLYDDLGEVWRSARRRPFDSYSLLAWLFEHLPQLKLSRFFWRYSDVHRPTDQF